MSGQQINVEQINRAGMGTIVGAGLSWWFYSAVTLGQPYDDWIGTAFAIIAAAKAVQIFCPRSAELRDARLKATGSENADQDSTPPAGRAGRS